MKDSGTGVLPYDIYFEKAGQRFWPDIEIQITVALPKPFTDPLACNVATDGKITGLDFLVKDIQSALRQTTRDIMYLPKKSKIPEGSRRRGTTQTSSFIAC